MPNPPNYRLIKRPNCCIECEHYELYDRCKKHNDIVSPFGLCDDYA